MRIGVLYSGGKDSTLAALLLDAFYDVTLVTGHFGVTEDWKHARLAAERIGFPFERLALDRAVANEAVERIRADGYPRNGIQQVHEHALEELAKTSFGAVADGTRRDDRVPTVSRSLAQRIEDRHNVDYVAPLAGFGRGAVDSLVGDRLSVTTGPSEEISRADYEAELRVLLAESDGWAAVADLFPAHEQTYVTGLR